MSDVGETVSGVGGWLISWCSLRHHMHPNEPGHSGFSEFLAVLLLGVLGNRDPFAAVFNTLWNPFVASIQVAYAR